MYKQMVENQTIPHLAWPKINEQEIPFPFLLLHMATFHDAQWQLLEVSSAPISIQPLQASLLLLCNMPHRRQNLF